MEMESATSHHDGYLCIGNLGLASKTGLTLFGSTDKNPDANEKVIGMFGSGTKMAVLVCLRLGITPVIKIGNETLTYSVNEQGEVFVREGMMRAKSCGCVVGYGQADWGTRLELALREFVSNAIDACAGDAGQVSMGFKPAISILPAVDFAAQMTWESCDGDDIAADEERDYILALGSLPYFRFVYERRYAQLQRA